LFYNLIENLSFGKHFIAAPLSAIS
jgi:hypothetical protein